MNSLARSVPVCVCVCGCSYHILWKWVDLLLFSAAALSCPVCASPDHGCREEEHRDGSTVLGCIRAGKQPLLLGFACFVCIVLVCSLAAAPPASWLMSAFSSCVACLYIYIYMCVCAYVSCSGSLYATKRRRSRCWPGMKLCSASATPSWSRRDARSAGLAAGRQLHWGSGATLPLKWNASFRPLVCLYI